MNFQNQIDYLKTFENLGMFDGCTVPAPLNLEEVLSEIVKRCGLLEPQYSEPGLMRRLTQHWFVVNQWQFEHLVNIILAEYSPIENTDRYTQIEDTRSGETGSTKTRTGSGSEAHTGTDARTIANSGTDTEKHTGTDARTVANSGTDTETHSGTDARTIANSGTDTETHSGTDTDTRTVSAYNTSTYQPDNKEDRMHGEVIATQHGHGQTDNLSHGEQIATQHGKSTNDSLIHGEQVATTYGKGTSDSLQHGEQIARTDTESETISGTDEATSEHTEHTHGNIGVTTNQELINQELQLLKDFNVYDWIAAKYEREMMIQVY